jgi:DNA-binding LytR/AlgR family response regulator
MKVIIIEDELLAAEKLKRVLTEIDKSIEVTEIISSVSKAISYLTHNKPDLIFLDIQLSDGISFSIFDKVEATTPIIFTTAYDQYAIKAFKLNSIDYLLKPIRQNELEVALKKMHSLSPAGFLGIKEAMKSYFGKDDSYKKRFMIQYGQKIKKVETTEIAYFYALDKNVSLVTFQNKVYPVDYSLEKLIELLNPIEFFRINRKMLIAFKSIGNLTPYSRSRIKLDLIPTEPNGIEALVSVDRTSAFREWLNK